MVAGIAGIPVGALVEAAVGQAVGGNQVKIIKKDVDCQWALLV